MIHARWAVGLAFALWVACGRAEPPPDAGAPTTGERGTVDPPAAKTLPAEASRADEPTPVAVTADAVTPAEDGAQKAPPEASDVAEALAQLDEDATAEPEVPVTPTPLVSPPTAVDEATCKAACEHAMKIALAEVPADAGAETREALRDAMAEQCPKTCLESATVESLRCILQATTVLGLGECP